MKRCPTCNKTFTDSNLSFCTDDGTPIVPVEEKEDELTEVRPDSTPSWTAPPAYQPPSYVPPQGNKESRRAWPWVLGIGSLLLIAIVGVSIAAVLLIPRMVKPSHPVAVPNSNGGNHNSALPNSNSNSENTNRNTNSVTEVPSSPPPTDKELVLSQLRDLEHEWTVANLNADKKKLGEILADDYVGPDATGKMQGKAEYINTVERDTRVQKWEFEELQLTLRGDRATLSGKVRFQSAGGEEGFSFVDKFVWRDNRWQATGSQLTPNQ